MKKKVVISSNDGRVYKARNHWRLGKEEWRIIALVLLVGGYVAVRAILG